MWSIVTIACELRCGVCGAASSLAADMGAILSVFLLAPLSHICGCLLQTMLFNWAEKLLHWLLSRFRKLSMWCHCSLSSLYQLEQQDPRTENQTRGLIFGDKWHCFWTFESDYNVRRYFFEHGLICIYWFWKFTRLQPLNPTNGDAPQSFW